MNLSDMLKGAQSMLGGQQEETNIAALAGPLLGMLQKESGGIGGLLEKFQSSGLGDVAQSWVGTGDNLPISQDQLMQVFGEQKLGAMAQESGMDLKKFLPILMAALPMIIDKLTPDGEVNDKSNNLLEQGMGLLGQFLKK